FVVLCLRSDRTRAETSCHQNYDTCFEFHVSPLPDCDQCTSIAAACNQTGTRSSLWENAGKGTEAIDIKTICSNSIDCVRGAGAGCAASASSAEWSRACFAGSFAGFVHRERAYGTGEPYPSQSFTPRGA